MHVNIYVIIEFYIPMLHKFTYDNLILPKGHFQIKEGTN